MSSSHSMRSSGSTRSPRRRVRVREASEAGAKVRWSRAVMLVVSNAECGMRNAESEAACARPLFRIPHSAFRINATNVSSRSLMTSACGSLSSCGSVSHAGKNKREWGMGDRGWGLASGVWGMGWAVGATASSFCLLPFAFCLSSSFPTHVPRSWCSVSCALRFSATSTMGRPGNSWCSHAATKA